MAPTSDERRSVAARLRSCVPETNGTRDFSMYLGHWVNADEEQGGNPFTVQANRKSAERTLEKLADLIDPTCHMTREYVDTELGRVFRGWLCDECMCTADVPDASEPPEYCPHCGARVTDGGRDRQ